MIRPPDDAGEVTGPAASPAGTAPPPPFPAALVQACAEAGYRLQLPADPGVADLARWCLERREGLVADRTAVASVLAVPPPAWTQVLDRLLLHPDARVCGPAAQTLVTCLTTSDQLEGDGDDVEQHLRGIATLAWHGVDPRRLVGAFIAAATTRSDTDGDLEAFSFRFAFESAPALLFLCERIGREPAAAAQRHGLAGAHAADALHLQARCWTDPADDTDALRRSEPLKGLLAILGCRWATEAHGTIRSAADRLLAIVKHGSSPAELASEVLAALGDARVVEPLCGMLTRASGWSVGQAARVLGRVRAVQAVPALQAGLTRWATRHNAAGGEVSEYLHARLSILQALLRIGSTDAAARELALRELARDAEGIAHPHYADVPPAVAQMAREGSAVARAALLGLLRAHVGEATLVLVDAATELRLHDALPVLLRLNLLEREVEVVQAVCDALVALADHRVAPMLLDMVASGGRLAPRRSAVEALGQVGGDKALRALTAAAQGADPWLLRSVLLALSYLRAPQAEAFIRCHLDHAEQRVRLAAAMALQAATPGTAECAQTVVHAIDAALADFSMRGWTDPLELVLRHFAAAARRAEPAWHADVAQALARVQQALQRSAPGTAGLAARTLARLQSLARTAREGAPQAVHEDPAPA